MSEYTKMIECERAQRMNPLNRREPFCSYFRQFGRHIMAYVGPDESAIIAVADTAEALCVELDHLEANFTNREQDKRRKDIEEALRKYDKANNPSNPSLWNKVCRFLGFDD